ncbi:hypothetical protein LPJ61_001148 [Coemansia biformis]|uniref:Uncharacterized protein n=1 Tax=Coemansia biformis TaxID=1286918 RepID=A0A9W7YAI9_9FUNG|nr:hypothetical protein LPJ61_001148 [Coemansia biformis]
MSEAAVESEAQRRRRLRQERIRNRGGDGLSRIKGTLAQAQEETDSYEMAMAGGHELKTATQSACAAGIALDLAAGDADTVRPRRRVGNLARKARLEAEADGERGALPEAKAAATDIDSSALHDTLTAEIADPAGEVLQLAPDAQSADGAAAGSGPLAARRFSVAGLARSVVRLAPVLGVFVYGIRREAAHERLMGDGEADVRAKWTGLLNARPDGRLDEWAAGNYLLWYVIIVEAVLYGAYLALADRRARPSSSLLARIPGVPGWAVALLPAGRRVLDSTALLLFLAALSIMAS